MEIDYLIIGQGICGTLLSWNLLQRGKKIIVFDNLNPLTASRVASGLINPISGKRFVKVNRFEDYASFFERTYKALEKELNTALIEEHSMLHFHESEEIQSLLLEKSITQNKYIRATRDEQHWKDYFQFHNGISEISPFWLMDVDALLNRWREKLQQNSLLLNEPFDWQNCKVRNDSVQYKNFVAKSVICCEGITGNSNPWFSDLPFTRNKGQVLLASVQGLERNHIYKNNGISIVPWKNDLFWIGSSFERDFSDAKPSEQFRKQTIQKLDKWLKIPYSVVAHRASLRPTTIDRMPFAGCSSVYSSVTIFNGMGTKGCMMAPYYAHHFTEYLVRGTALPVEIDIARFDGSEKRERTNKSQTG